MIENDLLQLVGDLVAINSVSPTLSNGPGEEEISQYVWQYLRKFGFDARIQPVANRRNNVVTAIPGSSRRGNALLLNAHLDTVEPENMDDPFTLRRADDRLYGRGAYDMKGSVAVMLLLAAYLSQHRPPIDILLTFVADEEDKSAGMDHLLSQWLPQAVDRCVGAIFLEPTEENIGVGHKGFIWYEIEVIGKEAHGSRPAEGIDAILPLQAALRELSHIDAELSGMEEDALLGRPSLHAGKIEGGTALSVIPSRSRLQWERRTLPRERPAQLHSEFERVIRATKNVPGGHQVRGSAIFTRSPYEVPMETPIVKLLEKLSPRSKCVGIPFWADSALAGNAGIPSILFGPVGHGAHSREEWVSLKSLVRVCETLKKLVLVIEHPPN